MAKSSKNYTPFTMKMKLQDVLDDNMKTPGRPLVLSGKHQKSIKVVKPDQVLSVKRNLVKIQSEADPVQFLIDVQNGALFTTSYVDEEGNVVTEYNQYSMEERLSTAKFLARSILPALTITKVVNDDHGAEESNGSKLSRFDQIVEMASSRANEVPRRAIREAEIIEDGPINKELGGSHEEQEPVLVYKPSPESIRSSRFDHHSNGSSIPGFAADDNSDG